MSNTAKKFGKKKQPTKQGVSSYQTDTAKSLQRDKPSSNETKK